jgi:hypothetical protein
VANGFETVIIPAGQTGTWQPLDYRIFGILKPRAKLEWEAEHARQFQKGVKVKLNMLWAIACLAKVWGRIERRLVTRAWSRLAR